MNTESFRRRLAAILSADVEGYSLLMREDEEWTIRTITEYRKAVATLIEKYRGRVVDSPGDNILGEFTSVVDAVNCSVEIQRELAERNAELSGDRKMLFRIGVNLGDVIDEGKRIYGDGVNVAARMESLSEGGGICISGTVYDAIESKIGLAYESLGEQTVKNIPKPVRAYRVLTTPGAAAHRVRKAKRAVERTGRKTALVIVAVLVIVAAAWAVWQFELRPTVPSVEPASEKKMRYPLPDKPSIAVLPFENLSDDPSQENIVDGITDAIITGLSKTPQMFVIARNSVFTYKGKPVKVKQVSEDLGVRYVLEGSVQKEGDRLRINAQLIDAIKGHHLWAEKYDRELKDLFALQDDITKKVITELQVKLTDGEYARMVAKSTDNLEAYLKCLQALPIQRRITKENNLLARKMWQEIIALDQNYAFPHAYLGINIVDGVMFGWSKSPKEDLARAEESVLKAIKLDDSLGINHRFLGDIHRVRKQWDKAVEEMERGVSIDPNAQTMYGLAITLFIIGRHEESIAWFKKAFRLDPIPPAAYIFNLGLAYFLAERYEEALSEFKRAFRKGGFNPEWLHINLAATYAMLGRDEEARHHAAEVLKINPKYSIKGDEQLISRIFKNQADVDHQINARRKAGLPEKPPPPPLPEKPSIAVLPFANISGDPKEDYLSDGITENIITALSKTPKMLVIARNSVFTYKGKPVMVQQVSKDLGVRYVLEGSVQKEGDRLRITAQLIDGKTGNHIWSDRYDRDLKDLFELQDDITKNVITALQVKLTQGEMAPIYGKGTKNLEAYLKCLQAIPIFRRTTKDDNLKARKMFKNVIALDPNYPLPYIYVGYSYLNDARFRWSKSPKEDLARAEELALKALDLDDSLGLPHRLLAEIYARKKQWDSSLAEAELAVSIDPNTLNMYGLGAVLRWVGRYEESIAWYKKAFRLDPFPSSVRFWGLGDSYSFAKRYEDALTAYKSLLERAKKGDFSLFYAHISLVHAYQLLGQEEEARHHAAEVLRLNPNFSLERYIEFASSWNKNQNDVDRLANALRKAWPPE